MKKYWGNVWFTSYKTGITPQNAPSITQINLVEVLEQN